jgi:hypothetical protein
LTLTTHHTNDCNRAITIKPLIPAMGSLLPAPRSYHIEGVRCGFKDGFTLHFQSGPPAEVGNNGLTHEVLTAIMIDRLEHFQRGPFACVENEIILSHFKSALAEMAKRSQARVERGVEGTHQV